MRDETKSLPGKYEKPRFSCRGRETKTKGLPGKHGHLRRLPGKCGRDAYPASAGETPTRQVRARRLPGKYEKPKASSEVHETRRGPTRQAHTGEKAYPASAGEAGSPKGLFETRETYPASAGETPTLQVHEPQGAPFLKETPKASGPSLLLPGRCRAKRPTLQPQKKPSSCKKEESPVQKSPRVECTYIYPRGPWAAFFEKVSQERRTRQSRPSFLLPL